MEAQSIKMAVLSNKVHYIAYMLWLVILILQLFYCLKVVNNCETNYLLPIPFFKVFE